MSYQYQLRRGIASLWTSVNPILPEGIQGYETDTKKMKIGNGTSAWTSLPYWYDDAAKQDALVSGTSIKTINSESLLGSGNIAISGMDFATTETVQIGSGETFTTLNAALEHYSKKIPYYLSSGILVTLNLKAGFVMAEQVVVDGLDLGWITITGTDAETTITRSALTNSAFGVSTIYPAFGCYYGTFPIINQLFSMDSSGTATNRRGVWFVASRGIIASGKGVKNAGGDGLAATSASIVNAASSVFSGAGNIGALANNGSILNARGMNAQKGASPDTSDFYVDGGGVINAVSATGGLSQTANVSTVNGIIYQ
jgi:hypothetical protein